MIGLEALVLVASIAGVQEPSSTEVLSVGFGSASFSGESVAVAVRVTPALATGTVEVSSGDSSCTVTLPNLGCYLQFPTIGPQLIEAHYLGDADYAPSSGRKVHSVRQASWPQRVGETLENDALDIVRSSGVSTYSNVLMSSDGSVVVFDSQTRDFAHWLGGGVVRASEYDERRRSLLSIGVDSHDPSLESHVSGLSDNGRFVTVAAGAAHRYEWSEQVILIDRFNQTSELISVNSVGQSFFAKNALVGDDGRFVFFEGRWDSPVLFGSNDGGGFVRDRRAGTTTPIGYAILDDISADGRTVALLRPEDSILHVFTYHHPRREFSPVSLSLPGDVTVDVCINSAISADASIVAFACRVESNGQYAGQRVFVRDEDSGSTELVGFGNLVALSGDGNVVAFETADSLVADDQNEAPDIYLFDRTAETFLRAPAGEDATFRNGALSMDGRTLVYATGGEPFLQSDTWRYMDVFRWDALTGGMMLLSQFMAPNPSGHGRYLTSTSAAGEVAMVYSPETLVAPDTNGGTDVFAVHTQANRLELISMTPSGEAGDSWSDGGSISRDGSRVAFNSEATNLTSHTHLNTALDIYVRELAAGTTSLATYSIYDPTSTMTGLSDQAEMSPDGTTVGFTAHSSDLVVGGPELWTFHAYRRNLESGQIDVVSVDPTGFPVDDSFHWSPTLSTGGAAVGFRSFSEVLAPGYTGPHSPALMQAYYRDMASETTVLVSANHDAMELGQGNSTCLEVTPDGRLMVFSSTANNLDPEDFNGASDIFLYDHEMGSLRRISTTTDGIEANSGSYCPSISDDGRFVEFTSDATNLPGYSDGASTGVYILDLAANSLVRLPVPMDQPPGVANTTGRITGDGHYVFFSAGHYSGQQPGLAPDLYMVPNPSVEHAPRAMDDYFAVDETAGTVVLDLFLNESSFADSDPNGDSFEVTAVNGDSNLVGNELMLQSGATITVLANGSAQYRPGQAAKSGEASADHFEYTIADTSNGVDSADVTIVRRPVNQPPQLIDDLLPPSFEDQGVLIDVATLLANDDAGDVGDTLTIVGVGSVSGGIVDLVGQQIQFTPLPNFYGPAGFEYEAEDSAGNSSLAAVSWSVEPVNDPPLAIASDVLRLPQAAPVTLVGWAGRSIGGPNESSDSIVEYTVSEVSDPDNVLQALSTTAFGGLSFTQTGHVGTATIELIVEDSAGLLSEPMQYQVVVAPGFDLSVEKTNGQTSIEAGDLTEYVITVINHSQIEAVGVNYHDEIPPELEVIDWSCIAEAATCPSTFSDFGFGRMDLQPGGQVEFYVLAQAASDLEAGDWVANSVRVFPPLNTLDPNPANNSATDVDVVALFISSFE